MKEQTDILDVYSPLSGLVVSREQIPDPVFAQSMVGDGCGIEPFAGEVVAPFDGRIRSLHAAHHAVTVESASGIQVLIHVGIDTVSLKGQGFKPLVKVGDQVRTGQTLLEFQIVEVAQKAKSLISPVVVVSGGETPTLVTSAGKAVKAGLDVLFRVKPQRKTEGPAKEASPSAKSAPFSLQLAQGLHARPAARMVAEAKKFQSDIWLVKGSQKSSLKSLVSLLELEVEPDDHVTVRAEGPDAKEAVTALAQFLRSLVEKAEDTKTQATPPHPKTSTANGTLTGISASSGMAAGHIFQLAGQNLKLPTTSKSPKEELALLDKAIQEARKELSGLPNEKNSPAAGIFAAHLDILEDPTWREKSDALINAGTSAAVAWNRTIESSVDRLAKAKNALLAQRANDLRDVGQRVLRKLLGQEAEAIELPAESILVVNELTPSQVVQLDRSRVRGVATVSGGATSHVAIIARSLALPVVSGLPTTILQIPSGTRAILNADQGELRLNPSEQDEKMAQEDFKAREELDRAAKEKAFSPATTRDGKIIEVSANIGGLHDAEEAMRGGGDGVGLLRSEFLFLDRDQAPSVDEQLKIYQDISNELKDRPFVVRTLDVGGDKPLRYLPQPPEENPFLGVRGLRLGLRNPDLLRDQLLALSRVQHRGKFCVMFPMVTTVDELLEAKSMFQSLLGGKKVEVGIMIEVPAAALTAEIFAPHVDFFSVGTNDLAQYVLAMDRGHEALAKQGDALHPGVLKLIDLTCQAAKKFNRWVGVCGGLAGDPEGIPLLVGMGVYELSVAVPSLAHVKASVRNLDTQNARQLADECLKLSDATEVRERVKKWSQQ